LIIIEQLLNVLNVSGDKNRLSVEPLDSHRKELTSLLQRGQLLHKKFADSFLSEWPGRWIEFVSAVIELKDKK